jgi:metallophosphoesterase (TIGR00282 family)
MDQESPAFDSRKISSSPLRALMIGDVVGEPGLKALESLLPGLIQENAVDFVVVNGENAADGFGMTEAAFRRIIAVGADVVTSGNHIWEKRDFLPILEEEPRILRPGNYPAGAPGRGWVRLEKNREPDGSPVSWLVVNLQGREYMTPIDCPFRCFDAVMDTQAVAAEVTHSTFTPEGDLPEVLKKAGDIILVDFHAESAREKESLAYYLDGRASLVVGTHTHVPTADERILPRGTAYITDLGMTGVADGVIGMDPNICLNRARSQVLYRMECAKEDGLGAAVQGVFVEINQDTGKALSIRRIATNRPC